MSIALSVTCMLAQAQGVDFETALAALPPLDLAGDEEPNPKWEMSLKLTEREGQGSQTLALGQGLWPNEIIRKWLTVFPVERQRS